MRFSRLICVIAAVGATGCAGDGTAELPAIEPICDGSSEPRLVYASSAGFGQIGDGFTAVNGKNYLVVNGLCEYVIGDNSLKGLRRGTLESSQTLSSRLHFGRYGTAEGFLGTVCPEGGVIVLADNTGSLVDIGCGEEEAPRVWQEAFREVWSLFMDLEDEGSYDWSSTRVLPVRPSESVTRETVLSWNSPLDLEESAVDYVDLLYGRASVEGVLITDAGTLSELDELRRARLRQDPYASELFVEDSSGRTYQLLVRDQLPSSVSGALQRELREAAQRLASQ